MWCRAQTQQFRLLNAEVRLRADLPCLSCRTLAQQVSGLNADLIVKDEELRQVRREKARLAHQLRQLQAGLAAPVPAYGQPAGAEAGHTEGRQPDAGGRDEKPDVVPVEDFEEVGRITHCMCLIWVVATSATRLAVSKVMYVSHTCKPCRFSEQ